MAQKLSVTIALEGGKEIERQLADIGEAGKKAFADIGNAADKAGKGFADIKPEEVTAKLKQLGITGAAEIQKIQNAVKQAGRLESLVQGIASVESAFKALAANAVPILGAIGAAFVKVTQLALAWADSVNKAATEAMKLGSSIEQVDRLRQGFERAGISSEAITDGLRKVKAGLDQLDVDRVKQAFDRLQAGGGIGSAAMKALQAAIEGTGKAADEARAALVKLADAQQLKSLQADVDNTAQAAERARQALAKLGQVPEGTPGKAAAVRQLGAQLENATIAAERARDALKSFTPSPAPLTGFAAAMEKLGIQGGKLSEVVPQIVEKFRAMPDSAQRTALAIEILGDKMGPELIAALQTGSAGIDMFVQKWAGLTQAQAVEAAKTQQTLNQLSAEWDRFKAEVVAPVAMPLLSFLRSELPAIQSGIANTVKELAALAAAISGMTSDPIANTVRELAKIGEVTVRGAQAIGDLISKIGELASAIGGDIWSGFASAASAAFNTVLELANSLIEKLKAVAQWAGSLFKGGGGGTPEGAPAGMAGGGLIGGRGTGTSDSNLALVSRGEHIMPARAVRQPGVLAFLEALRRSGGDLRRLLDGMGRFALGGPVGLPAGIGGLSGGGGANLGTLTLGLPSGGSVNVRASSDVVDQLRREAALAQVRSGGRKPSRYT